MKTKLTVLGSILFGIALSTSVIAKFHANHSSVISLETPSFTSTASALAEQESMNAEMLEKKSDMYTEKALALLKTKQQQETTKTTQKYIASRGGSVTVKPVTVKAAGSVELLDWWKSARNVFSTGTVAVVTDVSTGKSFRVKRTMGTNHADCEALTANDTAIIKSIWGGFSWDVRPVIVNVDGRRLAASMSSMAHAGVDSAPAFAIVNNRSQGYGTGENLDVIKGNGMDGHFDIHFLNSTRHKDGEIDPRHQAAIKIAAKSK